MSKEWSILKKFKTVECLLKTLRGAGVCAHGLAFLVNHQYMNDFHLDFSQVWPLSGFDVSEG